MGEGKAIKPNKNSFKMVTVDDVGLGGTTSSKPSASKGTVVDQTAAGTAKQQTTQTKQQTTNQTTNQSANPTTKQESKKSDITPVNADDDFLRGFNEGYEEKTATPSYTSQQAPTQTSNTSAWDDSRKSLSHKGIAEITDPFLDGFNEDYEDEQTQPVLPDKKGSPVSAYSGYTGAWEVVQADTAGSGFQIHARPETSVPQTEEDLQTAYEGAKAYYDSVLEEMERTARENGVNTQWYEALNREQERVWKEYIALEEQYAAHHQSERSGKSEWGLLDWLSMVGYSGDSTLPLNNATIVTNELRNRPEQVAYEQSLEETVAAQKQDNKNKIKDWANEHPILATGASLLTKPIAMVDYLNTLVQYNAIGDVLPSEAPSITEATEVMREGASENMSKAGQFVYNTVVSAADSVIAGLLGNGHIGGAIILGAGTASNTANDIMERGGSEEDALIGGAVSGILEGVFEKVSLSQLEAMKMLPVSTVKDVLTNIAKSVATNASEEGLTELANTIFDTIFMGELSTYALTVQGYMSQGKSEADAKKLANGDLFARLCESAASGALMGVLFGSGASASSYYSSRLAAQGEAKLRAQEMPTPRELEAMNASEPEARGAMVMLNLDQYFDDATGGHQIDSVHEDTPVNVDLKYKKGWTEAQKAEADAKVKALTEAKTVKTPVTRRGTSASARYKSVYGESSVPPGYDVDHTIDLQLGGPDDIYNLKPLERSVNRSLGKQVGNAIKHYPYETEFGEFTIH